MSGSFQSSLQRSTARQHQRCLAQRRPLLKSVAAALPPGAGCSGSRETVQPSAQSPVATPLPGWLQWLQWPQQVVSSWRQEALEEEVQRQVRSVRYKKLAQDCKELADRICRNSDEFQEQMERMQRAESRGQHRNAAGTNGLPAKQAAPPAPPPASPWPTVSPTPVPGSAAARTAAAKASAAAATAWAAAAAGHEAAAHAAVQRAETQPAVHAASAAAECGRAAAAWRAEFDALEAARQADPDAKAVRQAAAEVEAAGGFMPQLRDEQE